MGNCMESEGVVPLNNMTFNPKMVNHSIDIYFFPASPPSRAALMLIKALGIKHNVKTVNLFSGEHMSPEFLKMNPMHTVPIINDNGFILVDSHVIMKYLVDQYAKDDSLYPRDSKKGALVNQRLFFNAGVLTPRFFKYISPVFYEDQQPDPDLAQKFEEALEYLDMFLINQQWIAGSQMTIADFAIISIVASAEAVNFKISKYPNLWQWYQRAKEAMAGFGYQEVNQEGADTLGGFFKSKINSS